MSNRELLEMLSRIGDGCQRCMSLLREDSAATRELRERFARFVAKEMKEGPIDVALIRLAEKCRDPKNVALAARLWREAHKAAAENAAAGRGMECVREECPETAAALEKLMDVALAWYTTLQDRGVRELLASVLEGSEETVKRHRAALRRTKKRSTRKASSRALRRN